MKQRRIPLPPPPRFTVGMVFLVWNVVLALYQMYQDPRLVNRTLYPKGLGVIKVSSRCHLSNGGIMNADWVAGLGSFMSSWMRGRWGILVGWPHLGRFNPGSKFSDNGSQYGSPESQSLSYGSSTKLVLKITEWKWKTHSFSISSADKTYPLTVRS